MSTFPFEILGVVSGVVGVYLAARQSVWSWPVGIINVMAYAWVFHEARLYPDMSLQGIYLIQSLWGWSVWADDAQEGVGKDQVTSLSWEAWFWYLLLIAALSLILGVLFSSYTQSSMPYIDSFTTAVSLVATYLLTVRCISNWYMWMGANIVYIWMYTHKGLYPTAALYAGFLLLDAKGVRDWRREAAS